MNSYAPLLKVWNPTPFHQLNRIKTNMDYFLTIEIPSEKLPAAILPMEAILTDTTNQSPGRWNERITNAHDKDQYIVTELTQYKKSGVLRDSQHEFVTLRIQPRPGQPGLQTLVRVSRTIRGTSFLARLGVYAKHAHDTISVLGNDDIARLTQAGKALHVCQLTWLPEQAPSLTHITWVIKATHVLIPEYHLFGQSCYSFAIAILQAVCDVYNGAQEVQTCHFLMRWSHILGIPMSISKAQVTAGKVATLLTDHDDSESISLV